MAGVERTEDERKTMNLTDPVADFLTRIRNAHRARHQKLDVPTSKLKTEIARILKEEGYIANYKAAEEEGMKLLRVYLKYGPNNEAVIRDLKRISRPGCRVYIGKDEIKRVQGGLGISIMTTPKGVMTGRKLTKFIGRDEGRGLQWNEARLRDSQAIKGLNQCHVSAKSPSRFPQV
jgi:small subunit ribosomal protein S8